MTTTNIVKEQDTNKQTLSDVAIHDQLVDNPTPYDEVKETTEEKVNQATSSADEAKSTIVESAIHAKDAVVEKVQELGHAVSIKTKTYSYSL